ncbi:MAG: metal ABC transporter substrate-binding protein [Succinivibrio sp.]
MLLKKIFLGILLCLSASVYANAKELKIVTTSFPQYDLAYQVTKGAGTVTMLLKPGAEAHSFEPTPKDIQSILHSDLFIYNGGENDEWIEGLLDSTDKKISTLIFTHEVKQIPEEEKNGMQHEEEDEDDHHHEIELDEHVWTSPVNVIALIDAIKNKVSALDPENAEIYSKNAEEYKAKFKELDSEFTKVAANDNSRLLVFADRFPILYFVKQYGYDYYAAFKGCSNDTEVSPATLKFLISKVKENNLKYIYKIELSSDSIANSVAEATGAEILTFKTGHNVTVEEFEKGISLYQIYLDNLNILKMQSN